MTLDDIALLSRPLQAPCVLVSVAARMDVQADAEARTAKLEARREAEATAAANTMAQLRKERADIAARCSKLELELRERASADDAQKRMVERQVKTMERLLLGKLGDVGNEVRVLWLPAVSCHCARLGREC